MFLEELEDLKDRYRDRFHLIHVLSREAQDAELLSGRLDAARLTKITETLVPVGRRGRVVSLCGPYEMVIDLRDALRGAGRRQDTMSTPSCSTSRRLRRATAMRAADGEGEGSEVSITLDGRRSTFRLKAGDVPVLEAALAVRSDAPFACKGGVCGTCRAKLVEGEVEMDTNYALEPEEIARGLRAHLPEPPDDTPAVRLDYDA